MALFVDGPASNIDDLMDQDAGLLPVAQTTGINISAKLRLAQQEIKTDLELWLIRPRLTIDMSWVDILWRPVLRLEQVVITPPLRRWETMHTLELTYRDAYFSQLVDRYKAKWQEYALLARNARESFVASGLGVVNDPLHRPRLPLLATVAGPQQGGMFYACISWANQEGQESAASVAASITIADDQLMTVAASDAPKNAVGFWVYAGTAPGSLFRQNDVLLPTDLAYTYIPGQVTQGQLPGEGQNPDFIRPLVRTLPRG